MRGAQNDCHGFPARRNRLPWYVEWIDVVCLFDDLDSLYIIMILYMLHNGAPNMCCECVMAAAKEVMRSATPRGRTTRGAQNEY